MDEKTSIKQKQLVALIDKCNTNLVNALLAFDVDCDYNVFNGKLDVEKALTYMECGEETDDENFMLAKFWYKARCVYFNRVFEINENELHKEKEVA